jgi:hypothetical protein
MGGANDENILRTMKKGKIGYPLLRDKNIDKQFNSFNQSNKNKNNNIQKKYFIIELVLLILENIKVKK